MRNFVLAMDDLGIFLWIIGAFGLILIECVFKHPDYFKGKIRLRNVVSIGIVLLCFPIWIESLAPGYKAEVSREKFNKELADLKAKNEKREQENDSLEKATIEMYLKAEDYCNNNPASIETRRAIGPFYFGMREKEYSKVLSEFKEKTNCEFIINDVTIKLLPQYSKFDDGQLSELYLQANVDDGTKILEYFNSNYGVSNYNRTFKQHYWHNVYKAIEYGKDIVIRDIYLMEKSKYMSALENQKRKHPIDTIHNDDAIDERVNMLDSINERRVKEAYSVGL